jgi:hypothetical protein
MFREAAPQIDLNPGDCTFVVQGYGNVGSWAARIMQQLGAKSLELRRGAARPGGPLANNPAASRAAITTEPSMPSFVPCRHTGRRR